MLLMKVDALTLEDSSKWDTFVANFPQGTFFHLSGWKRVLEKTFGYRPLYLKAQDNEEIRGILPLFIMKNLGFKNIISSIPFGVYGGLCADNTETSNMLLGTAKQITQKEEAQYLELKNIYPLNDNLATKDLYVTFIKELPKNKEDCLNQQPRKARAAARKGIDSGLRVETGIHLLKECYGIYAISVRNLGTPVVPFALFRNLADEFKDKATVLSVKYKDKTIASVLTFLFKDTVIPFYGGSLPQYRNLQPNNFMYLKLMEYGVENGYRLFDFGRSKIGTGSYKFKELQGFQPQPLYYQYYLNKTKEIPNLSPVNPKFSLPIAAWKRLPVWVTKLLGPIVVKHIGG